MLKYEIPSGDLLSLNPKYEIPSGDLLSLNPKYEIPSGDLLLTKTKKLYVAQSDWNPIWRFPLTKSEI
jgi:hypothetical protein